MATQRWISGSGNGLLWGLAFNAADINSLPNGFAVLSSVPDITNGSFLDTFADVAIVLNIFSPTSAGSAINLYLYQLNPDNVSYGDNQFQPGNPASLIPSSTHQVGSLMLPVTPGVRTGIISKITLPPGSFRWAIQNMSGTVTAQMSNAIYYRTYNIQQS